MASRSFRNNSPGNLRFGKFAKDRGAVDDGDSYARWETPIQGLAAMVSLLALKSYREMTVPQMIERYAPSADKNNPKEYSDYIMQRAGIPPEQQMGHLDPFQVLRVLEAMTRYEGWKS